MEINNLTEKFWPGIVENTEDPLRTGRIKIRVFGYFDSLRVEDLPWAHPYKRGLAYYIPSVGDVVNVIFRDDDPHNIEWLGNEHYNINLQKYLESLDYDNYKKMVALYFNHYLQAYWHPDRGLTIDSELTNIRLDQFGNIKLNLRDGQSKVFIGTDDADQSVILGNHWMDWFDEFVNNLLGALGGPYIGNLGSPVIANPAFIACLQKYQALRDPVFLSHNVFAVDNERVARQRRPIESIARYGDLWSSSEEENTLAELQELDYGLQDREASDMDQNPEKTPDPTQGRRLVSQEPDAGSGETTPPVSGEPGDWPPYETDMLTWVKLNGTTYKSGNIPDEKLVQNRFVGTTLGKGNKMLQKASEAFTALFTEFTKAQFEGKQPITITACYRTQAEQDRLNTPRFQSATPGDYGLGMAVDMDLGFANLSLNSSSRFIAFTCPNYQWFFYNAPRFGIWQPKWAMTSFTENWHWTYHGIAKKDYDKKIKELQNRALPAHKFWEPGKGWNATKYEKYITSEKRRRGWKDTPPVGNSSITGLK